MSTATFKQVPLLDLKPQFSSIGHEVMEAIRRVVESQKFILGEDVARLEQEIAAYSGATYGIGCASGSDALHLALLALGIGPGDEVLTTPYTFFATAGEIVRAGATPVFTDIEIDTFNMDVPHAIDMLERHPKVRAVIPVHLFGACVDMDPLIDAARRKGVAVIEDAAQSIGAEYKGRRAGSIGDLACFSFFPSKNLGAFGDGGMLTTNDPALAERLRALRVHGATTKYIHQWVGVNSRLDTLQAAILRVKLRYLDSWTAGRQRNAAKYRDLLGASDVPVTLPAAAPDNTRHIYNQFVIRCERRDELKAYLAERGVGTEIYYPLPLHLQPCFSNLGYKSGQFPVSEKVANDSLALPIYPELTVAHIEYVAATIESFWNR
jgi:dTDP-4-amino-4,6-dideoxygalactose transaminase